MLPLFFILGHSSNTIQQIFGWNDKLCNLIAFALFSFPIWGMYLLLSLWPKEKGSQHVTKLGGNVTGICVILSMIFTVALIIVSLAKGNYSAYDAWYRSFNER
jgi:hypothetical protein